LAGFNIKKIFLPDDPETEVILNVDWRGAEIRIFTAYARDPKLIDALNNGLDVHSLFVHEIYGIPYDDVANRDQWKDSDPPRYKKLNALRTNCKRVVFGILYGAMAKKIAETAGISEEEAQKIIDGMFTKFPSLKGYMDETVAEIHQKGYVETLLGRRRRFPLQGVNGFFRGQAERRGKNMKIQSTSSDIVIGQLVELDEHMAEIGGRLCITVHDSIVATVKKKYVHQLPAFLDHYCVQRVAQKYPWLPVAFACDIEVGPSYGETTSIDRYLKAEKERNKTPEEMQIADFETEALEELRDDEEARAEAESIAAALGAGGGAPT
jgi:DNA polymerase-1